MNYKIDTVEEAYDELEFEEGFLLEEDEDHQIWLDGPFIRISHLNVDLYPGQYLAFDEGEEEFISDFSIYVFMKLGTKEVVYDEGYTSFIAALHNYRRMNAEFENIKISEFIFELHH